MNAPLTPSSPLVEATRSETGLAVRWTSGAPAPAAHEVRVLDPRGNIGARAMVSPNETGLALSHAVYPIAAQAHTVQVRALAGVSPGRWSVPAPVLAAAPTPAPAGALLGSAAVAPAPAPLLQAYYQSSNVTLNWSSVAGAPGYDIQIYLSNPASPVYTGTGGSADTSKTIPAAAAGLQTGSTYTVRIRGQGQPPTAWSAGVPVAILDLTAPVPVLVYQNGDTADDGSILAGVAQAVPGAGYYTFQLSSVPTGGGESVFIDEITLPASATAPIAFEPSCSVGTVYQVTAQAWTGNSLSLFSAPVSITPATVAAPVLALSFSAAADEVQASWPQVGTIATYNFQLWTTDEVPVLVFAQAVTASPFAVAVPKSAGLTEDKTYVGQVQTVQAGSLSPWTQQNVTVSYLDPVLVALQARLQTAWSTPPPQLNATSLGSPGAGIVALFQQCFQSASLTLAASPTIATDAAADTLTVTSTVQGTLLGLVNPALTAVFTVAAGGALDVRLSLATPAAWQLSSSFPALQGSITDQLSFATTPTGPTFVLSTKIVAANAPGGPLVVGLNLLASLNLTGIAATLVTLLPGAANPLPLAGQIIQGATAGDFHFDLAASIGSFAFTFDGVSPLSFVSPTFTVHVVNTPASAFPVAALWVGADVAVGGVTLPLVVQLPSAIQGGMIMLRPGSTFALGNLATFLGFVTGTNLGGALPATVSALDNFQINLLQIGLSSSFTSFQSLMVAGGSAPSSTPLWTPLPGVIAFDALSFAFAVGSSTGGYPVTGWINGSFSLGSALTLTAQIPLPIGSGNWVFSATGDTTLTSLDAFTSLTNGTALSTVLPAGAGSLPSFYFENVTLVVDPAGPTLTRVDLAFSSAAPWSIVADSVVLQDLSFDFTLTSPTTAQRVVTGTVSGSLLLGSTTIDASVTRPSAGAPWTLAVAADVIPLPSLDELANLVGGDGLAALLPASLATNTFSLYSPALEVNLTTQTLTRFSFALQSDDDWPVLPGDALTVSTPGLSLSLDWSSGARVVTAEMSAVLTLAGALFGVSATYDSVNGWTLSADLLTQDPAVPLDFSGTLTQFGVGSQFVIPTNVGLPPIHLTSAQLTYVDATGALHLQATSALSWSIAFGANTTPLQITGLGGTFDILPDSGGYQASLIGTLAYAPLSGAIALQLGGTGIDTVVTATFTTLAAADVATLADNLAVTSSSGNGWSSLVFPADYPPQSFTSLALRLNLTQKTFVLVGRSSSFGSGALLVQQTASGWQYALALNLAPPGTQWQFSTLSAGLAPVGTFFNVSQTAACVAISSFDGQTLTALLADVPELAQALPANVGKGLNFYGSIQLDQGVTANVPRILPGTDSGVLTLYALIAANSADSLFQLGLSTYTLAGVVTFESVFLRYKPSAPTSLLLHGTVKVVVSGTTYAFLGDLSVGSTSASLSVGTTQAIVAPFGMTGITINALQANITYAFPDAATTSLTIALNGNVTIGSVGNLAGGIYLLDGTPIIASVGVSDFSISNFFQQVMSVSWPSSLLPIDFTSAEIYYYKPVTNGDLAPITFNGKIYQPGFNIAAHLLILGRGATLAITVQPAAGITATGTLDEPLQWGFIVISGQSSSSIGPSASLTTVAPASFSLAAALTLFGFDVGNITFTLTKDTAHNETVASVQFTRNLPVVGNATLTFYWSKSRGIWIDPFGVNLPAVNFTLENLTSSGSGCVGKQFLKALPIKTQYNFTTGYSLSGGALLITVQGYFDLAVMNNSALRVNLQSITLTVPLSDTAFSFSTLPGYIQRLITDNAYSIFQQVFNDPASMAKLLAIEGAKFAVSALVDALVCENAELWAEGAAETFVEAALGAYAQEVIIGGVAVVVGGVGAAIAGGGGGGGGGDDDDDDDATIGGGGGGGSPPPPKPGVPANLAASYTNDQLTLTWGAASNATAYAYNLVNGSGQQLSTNSNFTDTRFTVTGGPSLWGASLSLSVCALNQGVRGDSSPAYTFTVPTPLGTAQQLKAAGTSAPDAAPQLKRIFPGLTAAPLGSALVAAYGMSDPATWATPLAQAERNGGFTQDEARVVLQTAFSSISAAQLAAALQAAYTLTPAQLAAELKTEGLLLNQAAEALVSLISPSPTAATIITLLQGAYQPPTLTASALAGALAYAAFPAPQTASALTVALTLNSSDLAVALVAGYLSPAITAVELAPALLAASPTATSTVIAQALVAAYPQPPITPDTVALALVATFTQSPAITPVQVLTALGAAFTNAVTQAPAFAWALVSAFTTPTEITPAQVATALVGNFTNPALTPVQLAAALANGFYSPQINPADTATAIIAALPSTTPGQMATALVATFATPALTPTQASAALIAAFTTAPAITASAVAQALVTSFVSPTAIEPADVATALVATFTQPQAITAGQVTTALSAAFPSLTAPTLALSLTTAFPDRALLSPSSVAQLLVGTFTSPAITPVELTQALVAGFASPAPLTPAEAAAALVAACTTPAPIAPSLVAQTLVAVFTSPALTPSNLAGILAAAFTDPALTPTQVSTALVASFITAPAITLEQAAQALCAVFTQPALSPTDVAVALAGSFPESVLTPTAVGQTLLAVFSTLAPPPFAVAIVAAFPATTAQELSTELLAAFATPALTAVQLAQSLVAAITLPTPITAGQVASLLTVKFTALTPAQACEALVESFVTPNLGPADAVIALRQGFATPPLTVAQAAAALVAAFTYAPAITAGGVAAALYSGFGDALPTTSALAEALVGCFTQPVAITAAEVAQAIQSVPASPVFTPAEIATGLVAAFTQPAAITALAVVQALQAAFTAPALTPSEGAVALVAAFGASPAITSQAVLAALAGSYPAAEFTLDVAAAALVQAFVGPPAITAAAVAQALLAQFSSPAPTPSEIAAALVSAFVAPAISLTQTAQALNTAFATPAPAITPAQIGQALVAAFPPAVATVASVAETLAVYLTPALTPTAVAQALWQIFVSPAVTTAQVAQALVAAFPTPALTATQVGQALLGSLGTLLPSEIAQALVTTFIQPPLTPALLLPALQATFTTPALTPTQAADALVSTYTGADAMTPSVVAAALAAAFTTPALTEAQLLAALQDAFASLPLTAPIAGVALLAAFPTLTAQPFLSALQPAFTAPALDETAAAAALVAAFTQAPSITLTGVAQALVANFTAPPTTPPAVALALVAAFTPAPTPLELAQALQTAFGSSATPSVVAGALVAAIVQPAPILPALTAQTLVAAFTNPALTPTQAAQALTQAHGTAAPPAVVAQALVGAFTTPAITASQACVALVDTFTAPLLTLNAAAAAVVAAFTQPQPISTAALIAALQAGFISPVPAPDAFATSALQAQPGLDPGVLGAALVTDQLAADATALAGILVRAYQWQPSDISTLATALQGSYPANSTAFDPGIAASALRIALAFPASNATAVTSAVGALFSLNRNPNDVAALAAAIEAGGFGLVPASRAFGTYFPNWNAQAYGLLLAVYQDSRWEFIGALRTGGANPAAAATELMREFPTTTADDLLRLVTGVYFLTYPNGTDGVTPAALALKAANIPLVTAAQVMGAFYAPLWNATNYGQLLAVYNGDEP